MRKQKSLRQLARELGVSHSYLSQVQHGKRPASEKVQEALDMVSMVSESEARFGTSNPLMGTFRYPWWVRLPFAPAKNVLFFGDTSSFDGSAKCFQNDLVFFREDGT
jgi:transcriptional regulator with XRE-family HTH domain